MEELQHVINFGTDIVQGNMLFSILALALAVVFLLGFRFLHSYRRLKKLKAETDKSWSNIQTLLTQRNNEIPKLLGTCREAFEKHDQQILEKLVSARKHIGSASSSGDIGKLGIAEGMIRQELGKVFKKSEEYPDLIGEQNFKMMKAKVNGYNNAITDRREHYNNMVKETNMRLNRKTGNMAAGMLGVESRDELTVQMEELGTNDLSTLFAS